MNHKLWAAVAARVIAAAFVITTAAACGERVSNTSSSTPNPTAASPSAVVIGQAPAEPNTSPSGNNTAQTTSPAGANGELSRAEESMTRPREGDNHSYSTLSPTSPQKANGVNVTDSPERKTQ